MENSPGSTVCQRCGASLQGLAEEDFVAKLISALRHPEPATPRRAAWILGELHEASGVEPLIKALEISKDPYLLESIVEALGKIGNARAIEPLAQLLGTSYLIVRLAAVRALASIGGRRAALALGMATMDVNNTVRQSAAEALVAMREKEDEWEKR